MNGTYLDELDPEAGRDQKPIVEDCGILCGYYSGKVEKTQKEPTQ
jgi:hypothetical protein